MNYAANKRRSYWRVLREQNSGFTLIEVLVVAAILVMLAGVAVPQLLRSYEEARLQKIEIDSMQVLAAIDRAILNERMKGKAINSSVTINLTPTAIAAAYGLHLSETNDVSYVYTYQHDSGTSYIVVTYNGKKFQTNTPQDGWEQSP